MTSFQIFSDLHIEIEGDTDIDPRDYITPVTDILIMAGDIGSLYKIPQLREFVTKVCGMFKAVLYVPGNHEYYTMDGYKALPINILSRRLHDMAKTISNLHILDRNSIKIGNVCVVGCTLWSDPKTKVPKFIVRVNGMSDTKYKNMYRKDLQYIETMIDYCHNKGYKLVVVTHHCPSYSIVPPAKLKKDKYISLYASVLDHLLDVTKVHTWVCGHIHHNFDVITERGCRLVGNQKGKPRDKIQDFKMNFAITV
jgi:predicted phosphohydrolase